MSEEFIGRLNTLASLAISLLAISVFLQKKQKKLKVLFGLNLLVLGAGYYHRNFALREVGSFHYEMEHFFFSIAPMLITLLFERFGKLELDIKFKLFMSFCVLFFPLSSFSDVHVSSVWLVAFFMYQMATFGYLILKTFEKLKKSTRAFERKLLTKINIVLVSIVLVALLDWLMRDLFFDSRPSALFVFPILYYTTILIKSPFQETIRQDVIDTTFVFFKGLIFSFLFLVHWDIKDTNIVLIFFSSYLVLELTLKAVYINLSMVNKVNLLNVANELVAFQNSNMKSSISGIERVQYLGAKDFESNEMTGVYSKILKTNEPITCYGIQNAFLSASEIAQEDVRDFESFFNYFDCHILQRTKDNEVVIVKLSSNTENDSRSYAIGMITALMAKERNGAG